MTLKNLLRVCNMFLFIKIETSDGITLIDDPYDIDDYFSCNKCRDLDDRIVNYIDTYVSSITNEPTLVISII